MKLKKEYHNSNIYLKNTKNIKMYFQMFFLSSEVGILKIILVPGAVFLQIFLPLRVKDLRKFLGGQLGEGEMLTLGIDGCISKI